MGVGSPSPTISPRSATPGNPFTPPEKLLDVAHVQRPVPPVPRAKSPGLPSCSISRVHYLCPAFLEGKVFFGRGQLVVYEIAFLFL